MSLSETDRILLPLAIGPLGVGENTRYDGTYDKIKEARRFDDPALPLGVWKKTLKKADYALVEKLCQEALIEKTKDFQIMAWLIEAWVFLYGLSGLQRGLEVMGGMVHQFWAEAFPRDSSVKEGLGDLEIRLAPFHWINEKLTEKIMEIPLTPLDSSFSWAAWLDAQRQERHQKPEKSKLLQTTLRDTPLDAYYVLNEDVTGALDQLSDLSTLLSSQNPSADVSFYGLASLLKEIQAFTQNILHTRTPNSEISMPLPLQEPLVMPQENSNPVLPSLPGIVPSSRDEAYQQLALIADYLAKTEPHSPGPYLIRRAISWSKLSLGEVFGEVLKEQGDLNQLLTLLGIHPNQK